MNPDIPSEKKLWTYLLAATSAGLWTGALAWMHNFYALVHSDSLNQPSFKPVYYSTALTWMTLAVVGAWIIALGVWGLSCFFKLLRWDGFLHRHRHSALPFCMGALYALGIFNLWYWGAVTFDKYSLSTQLLALCGGFLGWLIWREIKAKKFVPAKSEFVTAWAFIVILFAAPFVLPGFTAFGVPSSSVKTPPLGTQDPTAPYFEYHSQDPLPDPAGPGLNNLILITVDTLRADALGLYGSNSITPNMDALGASGVVFERAYSPSSFTPPSISSLMTGHYPSRLFVKSRPSDELAAKLQDTLNRRELNRHMSFWDGSSAIYHVPKKETLLAERLQARGYRTSVLMGNAWLKYDMGIYQGFDHMRQWSGDYHMTHMTQILTKEALAFLDSAGGDGRPFFLWIHYLDPHVPYEAPEAFQSPLDYTGYLPFPMPGFLPYVHRLSTEDIAYLRSVYNDEVRFADEALGLLLEGLESRGLRPNTLLALTSDHGEEFFEHGGVFHSTTLYEELIHVPLILSGPGLPSNRRIDRVVETRHLLKTLQTLLIPSASKKLSPQQAIESLMAPSGQAYAEHVFYGENQRALIEDRWKLIERQATGRLELYDLKRDPEEMHNLAASRPEITTRMLGVMEQIKKKNPPFASETQNSDSPGTTAGSDFELKEKLRSLGYLQ